MSRNTLVFIAALFQLDAAVNSNAQMIWKQKVNIALV